MKIDVRPKYALIVVSILLLAGYSIYQARFLIRGPEVVVTSHQDGRRVDQRLITVEGVARNVSWLRLNDRQIYTDENGVWSEKLLVADGLSVITVKASDRFGRETTKNIQVVLPAETYLN